MYRQITGRAWEASTNILELPQNNVKAVLKAIVSQQQPIVNDAFTEVSEVIIASVSNDVPLSYKESIYSQKFVECVSKG